MGVAVNGGVGMMPGGITGNAAGVKTSENVAARMAAARKEKNKKPKKKLNYNPREISNQLVRANKSRNAAVVLSRARIKLGSLNRAYASGQYNEAEMRTAMAHARRMVECSRLKVRNLKEEEIIKGRDDREKRTDEMKKKNEVRRRVRRREQDARLKMSIEENQRVLKEKTKRQILLQKKRMHRNDEQRKITEADMKYLEDQLRNQSEDSGSSDGYDGAYLDLSMEAVQMSELQMVEQQIQQQVEIEVETEYAAIDARTAAAAMPSATAVAAPEGGSAPAAAAPVINVAV